MTPYEKRRDEAAKAHALSNFDPDDIQNEKSEADYVCCREDFKAGADWGYAEASETLPVNGLSNVPSAKSSADWERENSAFRHSTAGPREWWVLAPGPGQVGFYISESETLPGMFQVIEKSAYDAIKAERDRLLDAGPPKR